MESGIWVDRFVKDKENAVPGIKHAVKYAVEHGIREIRFGSGVYVMKDYDTIHTTAIAHDDGCGDRNSKNCHLFLKGLNDITIRGSINSQGEPATILAGFHLPDDSPSVQELLPSVIWAEECRNLTLENLAFTREPETASAGVITSIQGDLVVVEVFADLPCYDEMPAYCMNRFRLADRTLLGAGLTKGFDFDQRFRQIKDHTLMIQDAFIASQVNLGEGLSWHRSGKTDFQLYFGACENLVFSNIRIYNTDSFGILTQNCKDITANRLVIRPKGNQLFSGSRDGWKIYRCTGEITLDRCYTEGVRMDGQNVHSNFLVAEEMISEKVLLCTCKYAPIPLRNSYGMEFYHGTERIELELENWEICGGFMTESRQAQGNGAGAAVVGSRNHVTRYRLFFKQAIPKFVKKGSLIHAMCWQPTHYRCSNSEFRNIAGAGQLLRCGNAEIKHCRYTNMMNAGILIGAELDTHCEGGHGFNILIEDCEFENCGFQPRYGEAGSGCIAIKSQGFHHAYNQKITIRNNRFRDSRRGVEIADAQEVFLEYNQYDRIEEAVWVESESTLQFSCLDSENV